MNQEPIFIITDLTHMKDGLACMAAVGLSSYTCIRPLPYLSQDYCIQHELFPGAEIWFEKSAVNRPHVEDYPYVCPMHCKGIVGRDTFESLLRRTACDDVAQGFGGTFDGRVNPVDSPAARSLITYRPTSFEFAFDDYREGRLRAHFDGFRYVPVNDLGYVYHFHKRPIKQQIRAYNTFLRGKQLYLRLGLTRYWRSEQGKEGYWLQVNGVYTFPERHEEVRRYVR